MSVVELREWCNVVLQRHYPELIKIINKKNWEYMKFQLFVIALIKNVMHLIWQWKN